MDHIRAWKIFFFLIVHLKLHLWAAVSALQLLHHLHTSMWSGVHVGEKTNCASPLYNVISQENFTTHHMWTHIMNDSFLFTMPILPHGTQNNSMGFI